MKDISPITSRHDSARRPATTALVSPSATASGDFVAETIHRYLDGLTTPAEEQQLRSVLEAQEAQGTILNDDERAALALLRLSFPEDDTAALLSEDFSHEYETLAAKRHQTVTTHIAADRQSASRHPHLPHFPFRRIKAAIATAAAVLALILFIGRYLRDDAPIAQVGQSPSMTSHAPSALDERAVQRQTLPDPISALPVREEVVTFENRRKQPSKHYAPSLVQLEETLDPSRTGSAGGGAGRAGAVSAEKRPMTPSPPLQDAEMPAYEDPDGAAILAAEQQRILEVEQAAHQRAIAVTQENTLACVTATSPS